VPSSAEDEFHAAFAKITVKRRDGGGLLQREDQTRIPAAQSVDHGWQKARAHDLVASDLHLSALNFLGVGEAIAAISNLSGELQI
jgi:hypothetical protein